MLERVAYSLESSAWGVSLDQSSDYIQLRCQLEQVKRVDPSKTTDWTDLYFIILENEATMIPNMFQSSMCPSKSSIKERLFFF